MLVDEVGEEGVGSFFFCEFAQLKLMSFLSKLASGAMGVEDAGTSKGCFAGPVAHDDAVVGKDEEGFVEADLGDATLS